jgi:exosome complex component RRP45
LKLEGKIQTAPPFINSPENLQANVTYRQDQTEILLSRILEKTIRRSGALDTEALCIIAGRKCFALRADVHVLDHDGNIVDASCLALVAALLHFQRPDVEVKGEDVTVFGLREREPVRLSMQHQPFCVSFSYFDDGRIMLQDAALLEEQVREGEVLVSMNRFGEVCQVAKFGGTPVDALALLTCTNTALERVKAFDKLVKERLAEDEKKRDAGGLMAELSAENERPMERPVG